MRSEIEAALLAGDAARPVAAKYGLHTDAVQRHMANHVPLVIRQAHSILDKDVIEPSDEDTAKAKTIIARLFETEEILAGALKRADKANSFMSIALLAKERRGGLELIAKLMMQAQGTPEDGEFTRSAVWLTFRSILTRELRNYPEARTAVGDALLELEEGQRRPNR